MKKKGIFSRFEVMSLFTKTLITEMIEAISDPYMPKCLHNVSNALGIWVLLDVPFSELDGLLHSVN